MLTPEPSTTLGCALSEGRLTITGRTTLTKPLVDSGDPEAVLLQVADHLTALDDYPCLGLSIGGHIDSKSGTVVYAPDLITQGVDWAQVPVRDILCRATGRPVVVENDVNCMAAHYTTERPGQDVQDLVVIYLAPEVRGLGAAAVVNGQLLRGAQGGAGEFGHVVVQPTGARCRCENRGCIEALLSVDNIAREINWGGRHEVTSLAEAASLVLRGDPAAVAAFVRAGRNLGQGLAAIINILNPARVILGGPDEMLSKIPEGGSSAQVFGDALAQAVSAYAFSDLYQHCDVQVEVLSVEVAAKGAAMLAADGGLVAPSP